MEEELALVMVIELEMGMGMAMYPILELDNLRLGSRRRTHRWDVHRLGHLNTVLDPFYVF